MSGVSMKIDDTEVVAMVDGILKRSQDFTAAMQIIGETALASIQRNFETGGRPGAWAPLSPVTLKSKPNTKILAVKGFAGGLLGSIHPEAGPTKVEIGTNKIYGAIHHFGGKAGRGHKVTIPARPYMMVQDEDWVEFNAALEEYYLGGKA